MIDQPAASKPNAKPLHEIVYVSTLSPEAPVTVVADIARKARVYNATQDITGLMVFDGLRFCQQIEGEQKKIMKLVEKIGQDPRHANVQIFYHGPLAERRFKSFSLAFSQVENTDLGVLEQLDGEQALNVFLAMLPTLDLGA
jgi:hypothetical protein